MCKMLQQRRQLNLNDPLPIFYYYVYYIFVLDLKHCFAYFQNIMNSQEFLKIHCNSISSVVELPQNLEKPCLIHGLDSPAIGSIGLARSARSKEM